VSSRSSRGLTGRCGHDCFVFDGVNRPRVACRRREWVGALDRGDDRDAQLVAGIPAAAVQDVPLQQAEEALHGGVVAGRADEAHGSDHVVAAQCVDEPSASKSRSAVAMNNAASDVSFGGRSLVDPVHQLLPSYACVSTPDGLRYLADQSEPDLPTEVIGDACRFYDQLELVEAADSSNTTRRHAIVGTSQRTAASVKYINDRYEASELLGDNEIDGDGTVSAASPPNGTPLDSNSIRRVAEKHANLQCNAAALDEVESIIRSEPIIVKSASVFDWSVDVPELISSID
jgi:hypothetical protein